MAGAIEIDATLDVFTGKPLVVVIIEGESEGVIGMEANLSPDEADEVARHLIISAHLARGKAA